MKMKRGEGDKYEDAVQENKMALRDQGLETEVGRKQGDRERWS